MKNVKLIPFDPIENIYIQVGSKLENGILFLTFQIDDPLGQIDGMDRTVVSKKSYDRNFVKDYLWKNTCFEFFVKKSDSESYFEFNANSSGHWNFYQFSSYREGMQQEIRLGEVALSIEFVDKISLYYEIDLNSFFQKGDRLLFSFSSVIELGPVKGTSYWAHKHLSSKPDFHDPNSFTISLDFN